MKKYIKIILITLLLLGLATGIFFYIRYELKVYNTLIYVSQKDQIISDFLSKNFPDQVKAYDESLKK